MIYSLTAGHNMVGIGLYSPKSSGNCTNLPMRQYDPDI